MKFRVTFQSLIPQLGLFLKKLQATCLSILAYDCPSSFKFSYYWPKRQNNQPTPGESAPQGASCPTTVSLIHQTASRNRSGCCVPIRSLQGIQYYIHRARPQDARDERQATAQHSGNRAIVTITRGISRSSTLSVLHFQPTHAVHLTKVRLSLLGRYFMFCQQYVFINDKNKDLNTNIDNAGCVSLYQGGVVVMVNDRGFNDQGGTAICYRVH